MKKIHSKEISFQNERLKKWCDLANKEICKDCNKILTKGYSSKHEHIKCCAGKLKRKSKDIFNIDVNLNTNTVITNPTKIQVPGDGNCFYHSIVKFPDFQTTSHQLMRKRVCQLALDHPNLLINDTTSIYDYTINITKQDYVTYWTQQSTINAYAEDPAIWATALLLKKTIQVWCSLDPNSTNLKLKQVFTPHNISTSAPINIVLSPNHFDYISTYDSISELPTSTTNPTSQTNTCTIKTSIARTNNSNL